MCGIAGLIASTPLQPAQVRRMILAAKDHFVVLRASVDAEVIAAVVALLPIQTLFQISARRGRTERTGRATLHVRLSQLVSRITRHD